ncbi:hypothetical protein [Gracilimonas sp. BCB1]|uniref:hypothetical protein n=1 Tax=Gracilimonas sp. BCB1 TaxID=3152362 RepID=UPI0032D98A3E
MKNFLLLVAIVLLNGCSILNDDTGSNSFEANIGSKTYSADAHVYQNDVGNADIVIIGRKGEWENSQNLTFSITDFDYSTGSYKVRNPSYYEIVGGDAILTYADIDHDNGVPSVTITKYDTETYKIKGSFEFDVVVRRPFNDYEPGDEISVKGNFEAVVAQP